MLEPFSIPFMQHALIAGVLVGFLASYFGVFIVQRRMAFLGSGLAHSAFGGVALGLLLNLPPLAVALPFTIFVAIGIIWVKERAPFAEDTTIGVFFAVSMALGVVFLALKQGYAGDAFTYLFGSILAVTHSDLWIIGVIAVATAATMRWWSPLAYATFDRTLARTDRLPVSTHDTSLNIAMAVVIVVSLKLVGMVLISAFLVLPAATARLLARTFRGMTLVSIAVGTSTAVVGLYASYFANLPSGPSIILLQALIFFVALTINQLRRA